MGSSDLRTGYKWWVVAMLWFVCFFNYADRQAIFEVFPKLKEEFGFDNEQLGYVGSAFMWVYAAGAPLAGLICDRFRRKDLILGGCLFWSFVTRRLTIRFSPPSPPRETSSLLERGSY